MKLTSSEKFPFCDGCLRFINNECKDEDAHLQDDCYQQKESFTNSKFLKWWDDSLFNKKGEEK